MSKDPIQNFFHNEEVFVTGATGLIGKSVVEKLLRSCPGIKKIYLLLRTKHGKNSNERLEEMKKGQIFDRIRNEGKGDRLDKLIALNGDIGELKLGLSDDDIKCLENVSIIFHIAATIRFDEPIKKAIFQNVRGTRENLLIAEKLKNVKKFVHCSTAYSNPHLYTVEEEIYNVYSDWENCIKMAEKFDDGILNSLGAKLMNKFPNTYTFSKHVAEHLVNSFKDRVPVVIYRPAIVINAIREPFEGWYDGFVGTVGLFATMGLGIVRFNEGKPTSHLDFVPLDLAAIMMIMVAWKDYSLPPLKPEEDAHVYHLVSRKYQPYEAGKLCLKFFECLEKHPFEQTLWYPRITFITNKLYLRLNVFLFHLLPGIFLDGLLKLFGYESFIIRVHRRVVAITSLLSFFACKTFDFRNAKLDALALESKNFEEFNYVFAMDLDCDKCIEICSYGVRKYFLKNSDESLPNSIIRFKILKWLDRIIYYFIYFWIFKKLYNIFLNYYCDISSTTDL